MAKGHIMILVGILALRGVVVAAVAGDKPEVTLDPVVMGLAVEPALAPVPQ
jgi:hypothetical protein